eukprot:TRINITY_DN56275_c0_g1_i1.p1 TRINITY_DN56275_c0_g1~~TRINITY_DN56275_c0_g1_i1.p1  ORF type:complete len:1176 (+),score=306.51 TRINITY_DN56275_c0_g1_i1:101-3628(+)
MTRVLAAAALLVCLAAAFRQSSVQGEGHLAHDAAEDLTGAVGAGGRGSRRPNKKKKKKDNKDDKRTDSKSKAPEKPKQPEWVPGVVTWKDIQSLTEVVNEAQQMVKRYSADELLHVPAPQQRCCCKYIASQGVNGSACDVKLEKCDIWHEESDWYDNAFGYTEMPQPCVAKLGKHLRPAMRRRPNLVGLLDPTTGQEVVPEPKTPEHLPEAVDVLPVQPTGDVGDMPEDPDEVGDPDIPEEPTPDESSRCCCKLEEGETTCKLYGAEQLGKTFFFFGPRRCPAGTTRWEPKGHTTKANACLSASAAAKATHHYAAAARTASEALFVSRLAADRATAWRLEASPRTVRKRLSETLQLEAAALTELRERRSALKAPHAWCYAELVHAAITMAAKKAAELLKASAMPKEWEDWQEATKESEQKLTETATTEPKAVEGGEENAGPEIEEFFADEQDKEDEGAGPIEEATTGVGLGIVIPEPERIPLEYDALKFFVHERIGPDKEKEPMWAHVTMDTLLRLEGWLKDALHTCFHLPAGEAVSMNKGFELTQNKKKAKEQIRALADVQQKLQASGVWWSQGHFKTHLHYQTAHALKTQLYHTTMNYTYTFSDDNVSLSDVWTTNKLNWATNWLRLRDSFDVAAWTSDASTDSMVTPTICKQRYFMGDKLATMPITGKPITHSFVVFAGGEAMPERKGCKDILVSLANLYDNLPPVGFKDSRKKLENYSNMNKYQKLLKEASRLGCQSLLKLGPALAIVKKNIRNAFEDTENLHLEITLNTDEDGKVKEGKMKKSVVVNLKLDREDRKHVNEDIFKWLAHTFQKYAAKVSGDEKWSKWSSLVSKSLTKTPPQVDSATLWPWFQKQLEAQNVTGPETEGAEWQYGSIAEDSMVAAQHAILNASAELDPEDLFSLGQMTATYGATGFDSPGVIDNSAWTCEWKERTCDVHPQCARIAAQMIAYPFAGDKKYAGKALAKIGTYVKSQWGSFDADGYHSFCHSPGTAYCWSYTDCLREMMNWLCAQEETAGVCCPNAKVALQCRANVNGDGCDVCTTHEAEPKMAEVVNMTYDFEEDERLEAPLQEPLEVQPRVMRWMKPTQRDMDEDAAAVKALKVAEEAAEQCSACSELSEYHSDTPMWAVVSVFDSCRDDIAMCAKLCGLKLKKADDFDDCKGWRQRCKAAGC